MLKVAIVGCGKIADAHASQIQRMKECEIVGVCDREPLMARQLYERFPVKRIFTRTGRSHRRRLGRTSFTSRRRRKAILRLPGSAWSTAATSTWRSLSRVNAEEARQLVDLANENGVKLTAGHNDQFSHVARRMRALVREGYLGGTPVHMESLLRVRPE